MIWTGKTRMTITSHSRLVQWQMREGAVVATLSVSELHEVTHGFNPAHWILQPNAPVVPVQMDMDRRIFFRPERESYQRIKWSNGYRLSSPGARLYVLPLTALYVNVPEPVPPGSVAMALYTNYRVPNMFVAFPSPRYDADGLLISAAWIQTPEGMKMSKVIAQAYPRLKHVDV